jgi:hypothetical protein
MDNLVEKEIIMNDFKQTLYEAFLVSFGKILATYNVFAQGSIQRDIVKEIIHYLNTHGFPFEETGSAEDMVTLTNLFVKNGFAEHLDVEPAEIGNKYIWYNLYGISAYKELCGVADNPFLACPLNLCLYYIADKNNKEIKLYKKTFDVQQKKGESEFAVVDKDPEEGFNYDPIVVENARLYALAEERADRLEKAQKEIKMLRGMIPICVYCKKVRTDEGYWQQVETYFSENSEALLSNGLCPNCFYEYYREHEPLMDESI